LNAEQFCRLAIEKVQAGQALYGTGDRSYDLFLVEWATIDVVCDATATEHQRVVYSRCAGDFIGELVHRRRLCRALRTPAEAFNKHLCSPTSNVATTP
jgi:hypothetical protein